MKKHRDGSWSDKPAAHVKPHMTVPWLVSRRAEHYPGDICIERRSQLGTSWIKVTTADFERDIVRAARGFVGLGLQPGQTVALFGATSYEWSLLDMAAQYAGLVVVPIYESNSAEQIRWILEDSNIRLVLTDTVAHASLVDSVAPPDLLPTVIYDADGMTKLHAAGAEVDAAEVLARKNALRADDLATVIYTSGTTGQAKGVELTHANLVASVLNILASEREIIDVPEARVLLFLPLAHVMARVVVLYAVAGRGRIGHVPNIKNLLTDIQTFSPTVLLAVPRVLEKVYNAAEAKARGRKLAVFRWAAQVAVDNSSRSFHGPVFALKRRLARRLVWQRITAALGENCTFAISAGAPLGKRLGHFYRGIGLTVIEAYGLTESTGPATANRVGSIVMGSVGQPIPSASVKIADDGEVLLKGPHIFRGYHNNPEATAAVIDEHGWFHSGDIGEIDKHGFTFITGRKKELIVTAGGKNVAPAVLEDKLRSHPLVSQVVAVGDRRPFVGALFTLDAEMLPGWLASHGLPNMDVAAASRHPQVLAALQRAVDRTNAQVSRAESIRKFTVIAGDFTEDNGLLTPSMKVRRGDVLERYAQDIDDLYGDAGEKRGKGKEAGSGKDKEPEK
ncbi:MAG: AMP-dependent synthetase/ligase [Actinomycetaceae bacterium]|nr:AMP-dependent synthetase/ligase [Actinomycetaceae bacterium]